MSWKIKVVITLTDEEYTEEAGEIQVEIEQSIPEGFQIRLGRLLQGEI